MAYIKVNEKQNEKAYLQRVIKSDKFNNFVYLIDNDVGTAIKK